MNYSLNRKILLGVVVSSTIVTIFVTIFHMFQQYQNEVDKKIVQFDTIMHLNGDSIKVGIWDINEPQIDSILKGIITHPDISYLELHYHGIEGNIVKKLGKLEDDNLQKKYELIYNQKNIGKVTFYSKKKFIYAAVLNDLLSTLLINAIKTFMASFLILFVLNEILTIPLLKIIDYVKNYKEDYSTNKKFKFKRFGQKIFKKDELDYLFKVITGLLKEHEETQEMLENEVAERTKELEMAMELAKRNEKLKGQFLANMSHEIRTPLNGVIGVAELLRGKVKDDEGIEYLNTISHCGQDLLMIINDILDFSKIEAGQLELEKVSFDLEDLVRELMLLHRQSANKKDIKLDYFMDEKAKKSFNSDPTRIKQILNNLVGNSVKFTNQGYVKLSIFAQALNLNKYSLIFEVRDSGRGIKESEKDKLFKKFSQTDFSINRQYGGTGLGLAISKKITEAMEGKIWHEDNPEGGSIFKVELPLDVVNFTKEKRVRGRRDEQFLNARVLVAEDNVTNCLVIEKMLNKFSITPSIVHNGEEAIEATAKNQFDLIFMDCQMPVINGYEATEKIILRDGARRPRIVALTANVFDSEREKCLRIGMDDYISKPISVSELERVLLKFLKEKMAS